MKKQKSWIKKHPLIFGLLIVFGTLFFLLIIGNLFSSSDKREFIEEYNTKLEDVNKLFVDHEEIRMEVNSNLNNYPLYYEKIEDYIEWVEINSPKIYEFKLFVESNYKRLLKLGVNPDYVRENIISLTKAMQENEVKLREILAYYKGMGELDEEMYDLLIG